MTSFKKTSASLISALVILMFGCGPGQNILVSEISSSLNYSSSILLATQGSAVSFPAPQTIGVDGSFSIDPALPAGLNFDASTGEISGTPTVVSALQTYTISASGASTNLAISVSAWSQQAYVKAPNAEASDFLGRSVSISGETMVVGANAEDSNQTSITNGTGASTDNSVAASGAAYVFVRSAGLWTQQAYLKAPNLDANDNFGYSVAISGDTIVVGAYLEDSNQSTITNGAGASADNSNLNSGAVYVFKRTGVTWTQEAYLKTPNPDANDNFGKSVAIDGDTIVVGATQEDSNLSTISNGTTASSNNSSANSGAIYIFKRTGSTWSQEAFIKSSNSETGDEFGYKVAISGDTVIASAIDEDSNQTTITNGSTSSGVNGTGASGAVFVYRRTGSTWAQEAYIKASNADTLDRFGESLSIDADTIVVGAESEDSNQNSITNGGTASSNNAATGAGAAYVYRRNGVNWSEEAYLKSSNMESNDYFGFSVAVSGDMILVGAQTEDSNQITITNGPAASSNNSEANSGAAYVFRRTDSAWAQIAYLKSPILGGNGGQYGAYVAFHDSTAVVASFNDASNQTTITNGPSASSNSSAFGAGAAFVYLLDSN